MHNPKYSLFYDNHTMPYCPDVGHNFDIEHFTDRIQQCGVDYLTFHARCNLGMAYYDTNIGIKHPSLQYDLFGMIAESCNKKGIAITAYLNAGISSAEGVKNPDWNRVRPDGRVYSENKVDPFVRTMCFNSGYHEHLVNMVSEIAVKYDVSGFFLDCFSTECICPVCIREMKERGLDWRNPDAIKTFGKISALRLAKDIAAAGKKINPEYLFYFNGLGYEEQLGTGTYLECECLPTTNTGYEFLPLAARFMRTIGRQPLLNMTTRFYDWADFGCIRSVEAIKAELLTGLALGLRPNIGSHIHPRGDFEDPVFDLIEELYGYLQERDDWYSGSETVAEIAIVFTPDNNHFSTRKYLKSAVRMIGELQLQCDVVTLSADWNKYQLLILPDEITVNKELARRLHDHLDKGGKIISSGYSGLDTERENFALKDEWGLEFKGECKYTPAYIKVDKTFDPDLVDIPLAMYSSGIEMKAHAGTKVLATIFKPYYNRCWDGEYAVFYTPPDCNTGIPALTINRNVAHFSHKIFSGYYERGFIELRTIFDQLVKRLLPNPILKTENHPSFVRAIVTKQPDLSRTIVHIIAYLPELRGNTEIIEDPITVLNAKISLRVDGSYFNNAYLAPEKRYLQIERGDKYVSVVIPEFTGYALLVFEDGN